MTLSETTTRTIDAPGVSLTYDVRPGGLVGLPPLFLVGSPMAASGFGELASHFADRTVVMYDPRGAERSTKTDAATTTRTAEHADDVHRIIQAVGAPAVLFANSGGAVNALALVAERLGTIPVIFPSHHGGFVGGEGEWSGQPEAFAATFRAVLGQA